MRKQTLLRAAVIAVLSALAVTLGVLCIGNAGEGNIVEVEAPMMTNGEPLLPTTTPAPAPVSETPAPVEQVDEAKETAPIVTNRLGSLTIRGKEIPVAANVDEATLKRTPGWMPESSLPGEAGMCVILGHRNRKHLRPLEKVEIGDAIAFTYPDGRMATYTVTETIIYEDTADWRLPAAEGDILVLVTCWPFRYSGNAPGKYAVVSLQQC